MAYVKHTYRYTKEELQEAIQESDNLHQVLLRLHLSSNGSGGYRQLRKMIHQWKIETEHFTKPLDLTEIAPSYQKESDDFLESLGFNFPFNVASPKIKEKLYEHDILQRECDKCGQGEMWHGEKLSLILDHKNGIHADNRLDNLRVLCPNCNATLATHCSKKLKIVRQCLVCEEDLADNRRKYCSSSCFEISHAKRTIYEHFVPVEERISHLDGYTEAMALRYKEEYEALKVEIEKRGYVQVGKSLGISDKGVVKRIAVYQKMLGITEVVKRRTDKYCTIDIPKETIAQLIEQKKSVDQIAAHLKVSSATVKRWLKIMNLSTVGQQEQAAYREAKK